ncbi:MAG TPA: hypothetical protein VIR55_01855 [Ignavibacteria bacterium]
MKEENIEDLRIHGHMVLSGGKYKTVKIHGRAVFQSDLISEVTKVHGETKIEGNIKSKIAKIFGSIDIKGDSDFKTIKVYGFCHSSLNINSDEIKVHGDLRSDGNVNCEIIDAYGKIKAKGNFNADKFYCIGEVKIEKELNADVLTIYNKGNSKVNLIGGSIINLKKFLPGGFHKIIHKLLLLDKWKRKLFYVDVIEGDEIYIEYTKAKVVRGKSITIGECCEVDYIEYYDVLNKNGKSIIKKELKIK